MKPYYLASLLRGVESDDSLISIDRTDAGRLHVARTSR